MPVSRFQNNLEIMLFSIFRVFFADFEQSGTDNTSLKYVSICVLMVKSSRTSKELISNLTPKISTNK